MVNQMKKIKKWMWNIFTVFSTVYILDGFSIFIEKSANSVDAFNWWLFFGYLAAIFFIISLWLIVFFKHTTKHLFRNYNEGYYSDYQ